MYPTSVPTAATRHRQTGDSFGVSALIFGTPVRRADLGGSRWISVDLVLISSDLPVDARLRSALRHAPIPRFPSPRK
eukprot:2123661-Pleurochrysis_carterae.AAC.1